MKKVIGYVGTRDLQDVRVEDIRALDVINIAFGHVADGAIVWEDGSEEKKAALKRIRENNPDIKILLSVGGWSAGGFSLASRTEEGRKKMAQTGLALVEEYGLDGIDIDWEYPGTSVAGIDSDPSDGENFILLLTALREALGGFESGKMVTIAAGGDSYFTLQVDMEKAAQQLDYVQLMTYDLQGGFQKVTGHHAALYHSRCNLIDACAHKCTQTFHQAGVPMEKKAFAVGVRIEHRQRDVSLSQYGPAWEKLPPSDYKLACHLPDGRSAFTFCVCPAGGQVVAAASEQGGVVTNGMSLRARDGENINGGLLVGVGPEDFPGDVLAGVRFQEQWERAAFRLGGESYAAPAQRVEDFLLARPSEGAGGILPTYRPGVAWTRMDGCLPDYVTGTLRQAIPLMDRKLRGFACPDGVLTGVETRSSSPVRILRDETFQSQLRGLYPCGEGAGYAGGIVSAAVDGIRVAEAVAGG